MIESYSFGNMTIDGKAYQKDMIILPQGEVICPWWRNTGHELVISDLQAIFDFQPRILVVGTGDPGLMIPDETLEGTLNDKGITLIVQPSKQAVDTYNSLRNKKAGVAACFHLTC